jgi:hypothetical protein
MEFGSIWAHPDRALFTVCAICSVVAIRLPGRRIRIRSTPRRPRPSSHRVTSVISRGASLVGFALALIPSPSIARGHAPVSPDRRTVDAAPPWSRANGFPPPRPLARAEATGNELPPDRFSRDSESLRSSSHPAIHGLGGRRKDRLFPRAVNDDCQAAHSVANRDSVAQERAEAMRLHPAGKGLPSGSRYRVQPGDTLWDISSQIVRSSNLQKIARFVDRLYETNRAAITDPDVIYPGQRIRIPDSEKQQ